MVWNVWFAYFILFLGRFGYPSWKSFFRSWSSLLRVSQPRNANRYAEYRSYWSSFFRCAGLERFTTTSAIFGSAGLWEAVSRHTQQLHDTLILTIQFLIRFFIVSIIIYNIISGFMGLGLSALLEATLRTHRLWKAIGSFSAKIYSASSGLLIVKEVT